jgi:hypothetical protein
MQRTHWVLCLTLALASFAPLALWPATVCAQAGDNDRAVELFRKARALHDAGKLKDAYPLYVEALALKKSQDIAANLGVVEMGLGRHRDAAEHLSFALDNLLPSTKAEQVKALKSALADAEKKVGKLRIGVTPLDSKITIDGRDVGPGDSANKVYVEPGEHTVVGTKPAFRDASKTVSVKAGESIDVTLELTALPGSGVASNGKPTNSGSHPPNGATDNGTNDERAERSLVPAYIAGGVGALGLIGTVVFELQRSSHASDADDADSSVDPNGCGSGTTTPVPCADLRDARADENRSGNLRNASIATFLVGTGAMVAYLLWWPSSSNTKPDSARLRFVPVASRAEQGLWLQGSF